MISHTAEYALRAMVCLASNGDDYVSAKELARRAGTPRNYLEKILPSLSAASLIETRRGFGGGHRLARGAGEITLHDVLTAVAKVAKLSATQRRRARSDQLGALNRVIDAAEHAATDVYRSHTLERVVRNGAAGAPIVEPRPTRVGARTGAHPGARPRGKGSGGGRASRA